MVVEWPDLGLLLCIKNPNIENNFFIKHVVFCSWWLGDRDPAGVKRLLQLIDITNVNAAFGITDVLPISAQEIMRFSLKAELWNCETATT